MTDVHEPFSWSTRLMLTYILAGVCFAATDKSVYLLAIAFAAWVVFVVRLFLRFRMKAAWSLAGSPLAFYWAFELGMSHSAHGQGVIV